ncbi:MAG: GNAT family N-acetyltransferase [Chlorogloeopsis fritschii C42_A2020_084]|uniref:GNAT family N-acetyltransferase n=1 Tax=Chlorogloeopsis fritschii TaxID=1124 RepID=UPI0019F96D64|nr:GNAT family N-acetyltransferase [Chlorogloeopsis fritschii]MBF2006162.1 GNAT family N-acetyltransferase [Chlorogloeopsis fritschii C42_A2020_084]
MSDLIIKLADYQEDFPKIEEIRRIVFQEGQGVDPDLDFDGDDEISEQLIAYLDNEPVGTARIRYLDDKTAKIERLAVLPIARGQGIGKKIMEKALLVIASKNIPEVVLHAQEYVKGLHQQLGFQEEGEVFEEAGIRHVKMKKYLNC